MSLLDYNEGQSKPSVDLQEVKEALKNASVYACDLETTGLSLEDRITIVAFAAELNGEVKGWAVETKDYSLQTIKVELEEIFRDESKICVFHNANFDVKHLNNCGIYLHNKLADTMIMAWLYDEDRIRHSLGKDGSSGGKRGYGLKWCVLKHLNYRMSSYDEARSLFGDFEDYAADDAVQTLKLYYYLLESLKKLKLVDWLFQIEMPITKLLIEAETRGVMLDKNQLKELKKEAWKQVEDLEEKIYEKVGYRFDIGSPKQWAQILFDEMQLGMLSDGTNKYSTRGKSEQWSTSNAVLTAMAQEGLEIAKLLLEFREINTRLNVFIKPLLERCRTSVIIHPRFLQTGTVTGRFASRDPNYQNLPRKGGIRKAFVSRPNFKIVKADYSQAELRLTAHMSGDPVMIDIYRNGGDIHQTTADACNISRQAAKACVAGDSLVLTENGFLRIDEIVDGLGKEDKVIGIMSDDGVIRKTESTYCPGVQNVVSVEMEYGVKVTATPDHEFMVMEDTKIVRKRADQLTSNDAAIIMIGKNIHGSKTSLPSIEMEKVTSYKDMKLPSKLTKKFSRFLGYYVSEGRQVTNEKEHGDYGIQFGFGSSSQNMIDDFKECLIDLVGDQYTEIINKEVIRYSVSSKKLSMWFELLGPGKASGQKCIPRCIRESPWEMKREFLRGYFEGDGTCKKKTPSVVSATSKSETLIRQLHAEMANVGILGYISSEMRDTSKGNKRYWVWTIRRHTDLVAFKELVGFISSEKKAKLNKILKRTITDKGNRYLDNVESLLHPLYPKVKSNQKDKLREIIKRSYNKVRFNDTRLKTLYDVLPKELKNYFNRGLWTAKIKSVTPASSTMVYDLYEPVNTAMIIGCNVVADCNFGLIYRMSATRLQAQLALQGIEFPIEDCYKFVKRYFKKYKNVKTYHKRVEQTVMERLNHHGEYGYVRTLGGRYRRLDKQFLLSPEHGYKAITQAINTTIQGGVSDLIKIAMVDTQNTFYKKGWLDPENGIWDACIQGQVHDEIFIECKEEIAEEVAEIISYHMENAGRKFKIKVPMTADAEIVDNLAK